MEHQVIHTDNYTISDTAQNGHSTQNSPKVIIINKKEREVEREVERERARERTMSTRKYIQYPFQIKAEGAKKRS